MPLKKLFRKFRDKTLDQLEFGRQIQTQRISQFESGGSIISKVIYKNVAIKVFNGNITKLPVDVVVSSDDSHLTMGGGVSKAILDSGGNSIYEEAQSRIPVEQGNVVSTKAGKLLVKAIYHAVTIDYEKRRGPNSDVIKSIVKKLHEKS